jgi:Protein of unknown function (DUF2786)/SprT-like family
MFVYSKKIITLINEIKNCVKNILIKEVGVKVLGDRFYDLKASYPINVLIYNNRALLGYFDPNFYELGFNECLMYASKEQLHNVIRHELAHYFTFIHFGAAIQPHGVEFNAFCQQMRWGEQVCRAAICLEEMENVSNMEKSTVFRKIQKLMALATSSNQNEAEQALIKSQQLLLKHNIESDYIGGEEEEKMYLKRVMKQKRLSAKMRAIAVILRTFFVNIVYGRSEEGIHLEILGNAVNIEIAEYVSEVLDFELDSLWNQVQQTVGLRGVTAKNSFFLGLAHGYCNKVQSLKREFNNDVTNALMVIEKKLIDAKNMVYKNLSSSKSSGNYCPESGSLGEEMGRKLNINPSIKTSSNSETLLTYSNN